MNLDITTLTLLVIIAVLFLTLAFAVASLSYKAREARLPAATRFVDVEHRLRTAEENLGRRQGELREVEQKISERDRFAAEAEVLRQEVTTLKAEKANLASAREEIEQVKREAAAAAGERAERKQELAELEKEIERIRAELDPERIERLRREREEIEAELARVRGEFGPIRAQYDAALRTVAEAGAVQARVEALKVETERLVEQRDALREETSGARAAIGSARRELEDVRRDRDSAAAERDGALVERDRFADERVRLEARVATLNQETLNLASAREEIEQAKREAAAAAGERAERKQELAELEKEIARIKVELDPERIDRMRREREELEAELARVRSELGPIRAQYDAALQTVAEADSVRVRAEALKVETDRLEEHRDALREETSGARAAIGSARRELEDVRRDRDSAAAERDGALVERDRFADERVRLEARVAALKHEAVTTSGPMGEPTEGDRKNILADLIVTPAALFSPPGLRGAVRQEHEALYDVSTYLEKSGLKFSRRTLHAFHTALKINDAAQLTVLAGVSGTGKSILPRRYADALGIHFLQVAVEPRWDSPQDLLGFYNYVEKKYRATDLARLLAHLDPWQTIALSEGTPDRRSQMALVLLDEMNLARVEYYFSEFLSRLESRPPWRPDLARDNCKDALIPVDIRSLKNAPSLFPAHNILFVGTMNDDESTQSLSDKVLDRGNILQFPAPLDFAPPAQQRIVSAKEDAQAFLEWRGWVRPAQALDGPAAQRTQETISTLALLMQSFGRPFGHRLNQAIRAYVANYPTEGNAGLDATVPLVDQVELRILPRLRGVQIDEHRTQFESLVTLVQSGLGDSQLAERLRQTIDEQGTGTGLFVWRGLARS